MTMVEQRQIFLTSEDTMFIFMLTNFKKFYNLCAELK